MLYFCLFLTQDATHQLKTGSKDVRTEMSEKRSEFLTQDATHQLKTGSKDVRTEMSEKRSEENGFLRPYMASSEMDYFNFDFEIANEKGDWKCKTEKVNL